MRMNDRRLRRDARGVVGNGEVGQDRNRLSRDRKITPGGVKFCTHANRSGAASMRSGSKIPVLRWDVGLCPISFGSPWHDVDD